MGIAGTLLVVVCALVSWAIVSGIECLIKKIRRYV